MESEQVGKLDKGSKLRQLRLSFNLTQKEFAKKLGLTRDAIAAYETNKNPLSKNVLLKINYIMGIESEYFESDMTLQEAFEKYKINLISTELMETKVFREMSSCCLYESLENYASNKPTATKINIRFQFIASIFELDQKADYHFIKLNDSAHEPFAKKGDILAVIKAREAVNGDFVITRLQNSFIIFQYFVAGLDEVLFKGGNDIEIRLKGAEMGQIEILGIIKQKISTAI